MAGKSTHDDVLDGALNIVKNGGVQLCVCTTEPTTYAEATDTKMLAIVTIDSGDYTGPESVVGGSGGRKLTVNQQAGVEVLVTGDAQHIAICDVDDRLLLVTTCNLQTLTDGNTVTIPAFIQAIADPT